MSETPGDIVFDSHLKALDAEIRCAMSTIRNYLKWRFQTIRSEAALKATLVKLQEARGELAKGFGPCLVTNDPAP